MNKESSTLPKNIILNWLYSTDMHVSLDKLGKWLEHNTNGKYKLVDLIEILTIIILTNKNNNLGALL
jgi:hypothetical protein